MTVITKKPSIVLTRRILPKEDEIKIGAGVSQRMNPRERTSSRFSRASIKVARTAQASDKHVLALLCKIDLTF